MAHVERNRVWQTDNEMCDCSNMQCHTLSTPAPLIKFDGGLQRLHTADEAAVEWLMSLADDLEAYDNNIPSTSYLPFLTVVHWGILHILFCIAILRLLFYVSGIIYCSNVCYLDLTGKCASCWSEMLIRILQMIRDRSVPCTLTQW